MQNEWLQMVANEGTVAQPVMMVSGGAAGAEPEGELPCPACGTAAPLVDGACSDCGLVLE